MWAGKMATNRTFDTSGNSSEHQLFDVVNNVSIPSFSAIDACSGNYEAPICENHTSMVYMFWPDGTPCVEMDLYLSSLVDSGYKLDRRGGSVRQEAVKLTSIVRYAFSKNKNLWELRSSDYADMLHRLLNERDGVTEKPVREANEVIAISEAGIRFFNWLQTNLLPLRSIVDVAGQPHQILLKEHKVVDAKKHTRVYRTFALNPSRSSPRQKTPMPTDGVNKLQTAASQIGDPDKQPARYRQRFKTQEDFLATITFRMRTLQLVLKLMTALACRPGELAQMSMSLNLESMLNEKSVILDTEKREDGAQRKIPVPMSIIIDIEVYIKKYRAELVTRLQKSGDYKPNDSLFINTFGRPLLKETLTSDFRRLCLKANLKYRSCLSMYRHRGITNLVALHFGEFLGGANEAVILTMTDANYSTLLQKVAAITGHKHWESLTPYIHLAWKELGAFDAIEASIKLNMMMETIVQDLAPSIDVIAKANPAEQLQYLRERLHWFNAATKEMKELVDACRYAKANVSPSLRKEVQL
ncbi:hypothetical protein [Paraburkholderia sp. 35.1]|uniref:hypothetical protein n=1 Tax=Paraburkholderia sp. 35.1 TaxID=2991058 RepID=UPI003D1A094F